MKKPLAFSEYNEKKKEKYKTVVQQYLQCVMIKI